MNDFNYLLALSLFVAYALVDGLYAYYTLAIEEERSKPSYFGLTDALPQEMKRIFP
jgi:hypothetical protein